ncbi:endonuclease/exonuclease/phosphatase family protein [Pedobacter sp. SD-b]|uniref:Endonuclease/exonuclease/phosphatase family protein n=1 Tax=Pedobacter segetis TaxID=2793069 RepID=A0ABS1BF89_9SPHI|nr:endonuclease/exonuclease/phosphatase family protein [Pedobacter segetis]MBK0381522.1 endonuclease/exonuclease/phosphatase family protein [Pedobacter segetis]
MKKKGNSLLQKAILFFNFLAIFCLVLSYLATIVDPEKLWYFTLFGLAYPFILLSNLLFFLIWLLLKRWYFMYSLIFILIGYQPLTRTFGFRLSKSETFDMDTNTIKLMSYNVHYFKKFGYDLDTTTRSKVLRLIKEQQPDIIGFEEFFTRKKGKYDLKDSLLKILNTKEFYYSTAVDNDYESTGVAIFSKYPIIKTGDIVLDSLDTGNQGVFADVKKGEKVFRVYAVHLASISFQPEDYNFLNEVKSDIKSSKDVISSKRIVKKLKTAFIKRSNQVKIIKQHMNNCKTPYIVMGDFNDTPASFALTQMNKGLKNAFQEKGRGLAITYNGDFPNFQIDYILASPQFNINSYQIIKKSLSDHYPIRSNVCLVN